MNIKCKLIKCIKPKFFYPFKIMPNPGFILDIGVGNDSYREFKSIYPEAVYHGIDYIESDTVFEKEDQFFLENLESSDALKNLSPIYDMIVINHVLEHLSSGKEVFSRLCSLLAPGGVLYAEFPSIRSAQTKKTPWRYHFHDDPTHQSFYVLQDLANIALGMGCKVITCGPITTPLKNLLAYPRAIFGLLNGKCFGSYLIHTTGCVDHIFVKRLML